MLVDRTRKRLTLVPPDAVQQLVAGDDFSGMIQKTSKNPELARGMVKGVPPRKASSFLNFNWISPNRKDSCEPVTESLEMRRRTASTRAINSMKLKGFEFLLVKSTFSISLF